MASPLIRRLSKLDLEEKILNGSSLLVLISLFLPWIGGRWLGDETRTHTGLGFYTSYIGLAILLLHGFVVLITLFPLLTGKTLVQRQSRDTVRLLCTALATVLILSALSVLMKVTFEFQSMELRFGIALALLGSLAASFYSFLAWQEKQRRQVHELFHHPEDANLPEAKKGDLPTDVPPMPPPPPPPDPEPHLHRPRP